MGGLGSGRDGYRPVVENGLKLDSYRLQRQGLLKIHGCGLSCGSLVWSNTSTGEHVASIGYTINYGRRSIVLDYTRTINEEKYPVNDIVWLLTQKTNFGGSRFLFMCPKCAASVAKLYLPNGALYFRCRHCYNLTYQSCNSSHVYDSLFRHLASKAGVSVGQVKNALKNKC